jgi:L-lysine exporter family protein LysE/ArgO
VLDPALAGLLTGLSLIIAIGAQNAYVLRQGLLRSHIGPVVAVCAVSDLVLIAAGVGGVGTLVDQAGWVLDTVRWLGVAFLTWYAVGSLRSALHPEALDARTTGSAAGAGESRSVVLGKTVALTWLNPHVYLDTVLLLGSIAAAHDGSGAAGIGGRWWFGVGAGIASIAWFTSLGFGARLLAPLLSRPAAWRILDVVIALTMLLVAARLALG